ncbi:MAG: fibronectin type III domain-containing protein [Deltaproteobacteria bacterium]|nr:fibronectin type III domain-containing protein [Deltaproteobacteria bacterium]
MKLLPGLGRFPVSSFMVVLVACANSSVRSPFGDETDAGADADASAGASADAGPDASVDADAGPDAGADADAGIDAGTPPSTPIALTVEGAAPTQVTLAWSDTSSNEDGFKIERKVGFGNYALQATLAANTTTWSESVSPNMLYYYRLYAYNALGVSGTSNEVVVITPPAAPTDLVALGGEGAVSLTWRQPPGATSYEVWRSAVSGGPYSLAGTATEISFVNTGLANKTVYYYVVRAFTFAGGSGNSAEVSARTAKCVWESPVAVADAGADAITTPRIAVDGEGNAFVAWSLANDAGKATILARRRTWDGGVWATPETVAPSGLQPEIVTAKNGDAIAVWTDANDAGVVQGWARWFRAGEWGGTVVMETPDAGQVFDPRVAVGPSGDAVIVVTWDNLIGGSSVWAKRYVADAGGWESATRLGDGLGAVDGPDIAMGVGESAFAVWAQSSGLHTPVFASRLVSPGGVWGDAGLVSGNAADSTAPAVAADPLGNATVVWAENNDTLGYSRIVASTFLASVSAWGDAGPIDDGLSGGSTPSVATDLAGNVFAAWGTESSGVSGVSANRRLAASGGWGTPALVTDGVLDCTRSASSRKTVVGFGIGIAETASPKIAVDLEGEAVLVWTMCKGGVWTSSFSTYSNSWSATRELSTDAGGVANDPRVGSVQSLGAIAVWASNGATNSSVLASVCR